MGSIREFANVAAGSRVSLDLLVRGRLTSLDRARLVAVGHYSRRYSSVERRQRIPASMKPSMSPSNTAVGLPTS